MEPIELGERLGRWPVGRGPLLVLLPARLRRLIDEGELPPGEPLPPDRALAAALAVGRSTVVAAYDLLRQDERIIRRQGQWRPGRRARARRRAADDQRAHLSAPAGAGRRGDPACLRRTRHPAAGTGPGVRPHRANPGRPRRHRLLPGRPPGAAPRDRRPLYRTRNPHRPGAHPGHHRRPAGSVAARPRAAGTRRPGTGRSTRAENRGTRVTVILPRRNFSPLLGRLMHDRTADFIALVGEPNAVATIIPPDVQNSMAALGERPPAGLNPGSPATESIDAAYEDLPGAGGGRRGADRRARRAGPGRGRGPDPGDGDPPREDETVEISDSTGDLTALFHGRDRIAGLVCGGKVRLRGQVDVSECSPGGVGGDEH